MNFLWHSWLNHRCDPHNDQNQHCDPHNIQPCDPYDDQHGNPHDNQHYDQNDQFSSHLIPQSLSSCTIEPLAVVTFVQLDMLSQKPIVVH